MKLAPGSLIVEDGWAKAYTRRHRKGSLLRPLAATDTFHVAERPVCLGRIGVCNAEAVLGHVSAIRKPGQSVRLGSARTPSYFFGTGAACSFPYTTSVHMAILQTLLRALHRTPGSGLALVPWPDVPKRIAPYRG